MFVITSRLSLLIQCPFSSSLNMLAFAFLRVRDIGCDRFNREAFLDGKMVPGYWIAGESSRAAFSKEN